MSWVVQTKVANQTIDSAPRGLFQRKRAGGGTPGPTGECENCRKKRAAKEQTLQRAAIDSSPVNEVPPIVHEVLQSPGHPLDRQTREFMEPQFGHDFSGVRVHTNTLATESARAVNAFAYTVGQNVVFARGHYAPHTPMGQRLLAHELTHVVQQSGRNPSNPALAESEAEANAGSVAKGHKAQVNVSAPPSIQRAVELRPPGRGEASAFERREELVERLNKQSTAIQYKLEGRTLKYEVKDQSALSNFDHQMIGFIDHPQLAPLRLITSSGRVGPVGGPFTSPVIADAFVSGYVDLDDMMAADDLAFQSILVHFLTERINVPNYDRRIGTNTLAPVFNRVHELGHTAQAEHFRAIFNDPSINFNYEEIKPNGTAHIAFKSKDKGYRVFLIIYRIRGSVANSEVKVQTSDKKWLKPEEFLRQKAVVTP